MKIGTRSVLFGAHCFFIHPWFVALGWWKLYGFPFDPRLWVAFFVHDLGYFSKPNRHNYMLDEIIKVFKAGEQLTFEHEEWLCNEVNCQSQRLDYVRCLMDLSFTESALDEIATSFSDIQETNPVFIQEKALQLTLENCFIELVFADVYKLIAAYILLNQKQKQQTET